MAKRKLEELDLEELKTKASKYQSILIGITVVILSSVLLYLILKTELFALVAIIPGLFLSTILPCSIMLSKVKAEIKSRNNNL